MTQPLDAILDVLAKSGLLLKQDKNLPNVVSLITGEALDTSWWSHPQGRLIFTVLAQLADHPDVLFAKLLHRKVTLVHRKLWPALLAVACAREAWQLRGLSASASELLAKADDSASPVRDSGKAVKELEYRLLLHTEEVHTESGRHETALITWPRWARRVGVESLESPAAGRRQLAQAAFAQGATPSALPWPADAD
jgi:hypothetical protein